MMTHIAEYSLHYFVRILIVPIRLLARLPYGSSFFKGMNAAYAVGAGETAYREKRYHDAFKIYKPIADYDLKGGYVGGCQYMTGVLYYYGLGIERDFDLAVKYLWKAVRNGDEEADAYLGMFLLKSKLDEKGIAHQIERSGDQDFIGWSPADNREARNIIAEIDNAIWEEKPKRQTESDELARMRYIRRRKYKIKNNDNTR